MKKILLIFICSLTAFSSSVIATSYGHSGKVLKIDLHNDNWGTYDVNDKGVLSLYIEGLPKSCNQSNGLNRVVITSDHALFDAVLSTALAAKLSGKKVHIQYLDTCKTRGHAWDFGFLSLRE